jgi:hypothetical protein
MPLGKLRGKLGLHVRANAAKRGMNASGNLQLLSQTSSTDFGRTLAKDSNSPEYRDNLSHDEDIKVIVNIYG